jgi:hypothetical protein
VLVPALTKLIALLLFGSLFGSLIQTCRICVSILTAVCELLIASYVMCHVIGTVAIVELPAALCGNVAAQLGSFHLL